MLIHICFGVLLGWSALRSAPMWTPVAILLAISIVELTLGWSVAWEMDMAKAMAFVRAGVWALIGVWITISGVVSRGPDKSFALAFGAAALVSAGGGVLLVPRRVPAWIAVLLTLPGLVVVVFVFVIARNYVPR